MIPAPPVEHVYRGTCVRIVDGDTYVVDIDLGYTAHVHVRIRLRGIDVHERRTAEGLAAMAWLRERLTPAGRPPTPLVVRSYRDARSFERWVADVWWGPEGYDLAVSLRHAGHEKPPTAP